MPLILFLLAIVACTTNQTDYQRSKLIKEQVTGKKVAFTQKSGTLEKDGVKQLWRKCSPGGKGETVLLIYAPKELSASACDDPHVQAFLTKGYSTIEIEEPQENGNARSFGSDHALEAFVVNLDSFDTPIAGLWAHGTSSIMAGRLAKSIDTNWVIFSEGLFDMELAISSGTHQELQKALLHLQQLEQGEALEKRSLAWDYDGLPSLVYVYYADSSPADIKKQAKAFTETLAASQIRVTRKTFSSEGQGFDSQGHLTMINDALKFFARFTESATDSAP